MRNHEQSNQIRWFSQWKILIVLAFRMTAFFFCTRSLTWRMAAKNTVCWQLNCGSSCYHHFKITIPNGNGIMKIIFFWLNLRKIPSYIQNTPLFPLHYIYHTQQWIYMINRLKLRLPPPLLLPQSASFPSPPSRTWFPSPTPRARTSSWLYVLESWIMDHQYY